MRFNGKLCVGNVLIRNWCLWANIYNNLRNRMHPPRRWDYSWDKNIMWRGSKRLSYVLTLSEYLMSEEYCQSWRSDWAGHNIPRSWNGWSQVKSRARSVVWATRILRMRRSTRSPRSPLRIAKPDWKVRSSTCLQILLSGSRTCLWVCILWVMIWKCTILSLG